jgi:hypothetical protein
MTRPPRSPGRAGPLDWAFWLALAAASAAGCVDDRLVQADAEVRQYREENAKLKADVRSRQQVIAEQQEQIRTLQALGEKRLDLLFHVSAIKLGRYTAGVDLDGKDGDDGVRVYLQPVDGDGHAIKAAGAVTIQLFDLAAKAEENLLGEYNYPAEEIAKNWSAGFLTYHYRFDCPWKSSPPTHPEITVRVAFTDYLTGKQFTAQKVCTVHLPTKAK